MTIIRLGYVAMSMELKNASPSRTMPYAQFSKLTDRNAAIKKLERIARTNLKNCLRLLIHNEANGIEFFRFSSKLIPLANHPELYDWNYMRAIKEETDAIKGFLKKHPHIHFNISHCSTAIAVVISDVAPVGIDIEAIREYSPYSLKRCFSKEEADYIKNSINPNKEFFRLWTLKESYVKAIGVGMNYPMKKVNFKIKPKLIDSNKVKCNFILLEDNSNYVTACCYGVGKVLSNGKLHRIYQCKKDIFHG